MRFTNDMASIYSGLCTLSYPCSSTNCAYVAVPRYLLPVLWVGGYIRTKPYRSIGRSSPSLIKLWRELPS